MSEWRIKRDRFRLQQRVEKAALLVYRLSKINSLDRAYLAGLIDGEGCIFINKRCAKKAKKVNSAKLVYSSGLAIAMTALPVLQWIKRTTNLGEIRTYKPKKKHKQAYRWTVWSNQASALLKVVSFRLILKRAQAETLIAFQDSMKYRVTKSELNRREKFYQKSKKMNKRGR
jgi:hypothetical protein